MFFVIKRLEVGAGVYHNVQTVEERALVHKWPSAHANLVPDVSNPVTPPLPVISSSVSEGSMLANTTIASRLGQAALLNTYTVAKSEK